MNLEENFCMCFKHRLKHIYHLQYSLTLFRTFCFNRTDENKYTCVKCMLNWMNLLRIWMPTYEFKCSKRRFPVSSEIYAVAKFMTSAKFMALTLSLTLIYDPNPNPIPCEILDACADSPIVINFASGEFRATPARWRIWMLSTRIWIWMM